MSDPGIQMPATIPHLWFIHNGDKRYVHMRGGPIFEQMRSQGFTVHISDRTSEPIGNALLLVALPSTEGMANLVDTLARRRSSTVLVDVVFPIRHPEKIVGSDAAVAFWTDPAHVEPALHAIRAADGVTIPHPYLLDDVAELNPNVFVVPDLPECDEDEECDDAHVEAHVQAVTRTATALMLAWHSAALGKPARRARSVG